MKASKSILILGLVVAMLFAFAIPAAAIGFDAEEVYESVFVIYSGNSLGSGWAIGENCIVTNAHVVEDEQDVWVETYSGDDFEAKVICMDEDLDIAILSVNKTLNPLPLKKLADVKTGEDVCAIGAPESLSYTLTKGIVSAKSRESGGQTYIQTDAAINHGNSGGPLLDDNGYVIGMNTLKLMDAEGIGLAIPVDRICEYMEQQGIKLAANGNVDGTIGSLNPTEDDDTEDEDIGDSDEDNGSGNRDSGNNGSKRGSRRRSVNLLEEYGLKVVLVAAGSLVVLVIVAVVVLVSVKKKKAKKKKNEGKTLLYMVPGQAEPDEVPDFEIEFLE